LDVAKLAIEVPLTTGRARDDAVMVGGGMVGLVVPIGSAALSTSVFRFGSGCVATWHRQVSGLFIAQDMGSGEAHTGSCVCTLHSLRMSHGAGSRIALRVGHLLKAHCRSGCDWIMTGWAKPRGFLAGEQTVSRFPKCVGDNDVAEIITTYHVFGSALHGEGAHAREEHVVKQET
jgi:hypothetical protein